MYIRSHHHREELHDRASSPRGLAGVRCIRLYPQVAPQVAREVVPCKVHLVRIHLLVGNLHVRGDRILEVLRPLESPYSHPNTEGASGDQKAGAWVRIRMDPTEAGCCCRPEEGDKAFHGDSEGMARGPQGHRP